MKKYLLLTILIPFLNFGQSGDWKFVGKTEGEESKYFCEAHYYKSAKFNPKNGGLYVAFQNGGNPYICKTAVISFDGVNWGKVGPNLEISDGAATYQSLAISSVGGIYVAYRDDKNSYMTTVKFFDGNRWQQIGNPTVTNGHAKNQTLAIDLNDKVYVAYIDSVDNGKVTVLNYVDGVWQPLGSITGVTESRVYSFDFKISPSGQPHLTYLDNSNLATVKRFNGTSWEKLGSNSLNLNYTENQTLTFDNNGIPFLAFSINLPYTTNSPAVLSFDGTNWQQVGNIGLNIFRSQDICLSFSPTGILHVAFVPNYNLENKIKVFRLNSSNNWEAIENKSFTEGKTYDLELLLNPKGMLHLFKNIKFIEEYPHDFTTVLTFNGTSWGKLKPLGNSFGGVDYVNMEFTKEGKVFIAYRDLENDFKTNVITLNSNNNFENVGNEGISDGESKFQTLAINSKGVPFVAYQDRTKKSRTTVLSFDGSNWNTVGVISGIGTDSAYFQKIAFDSDDLLYLAYANPFKNGSISVLKYSSGNWIQVGTNIGSTNYLSLAIDANKIPYLAYADLTNNKKLNVKKYINSNWEIVGTSGVSAGATGYLSLVLNSSQNPIVAYSDMTIKAGALTVMSFNGVNWRPVEKEGASFSGIHYVSLTLNKDGLPFAGFQHDAFFGKTAVLGYVSNYWDHISDLRESIGYTYNHSLRFHPTTNKLWLANAGCSRDLFVQKYTGTLSIENEIKHENSIAIYPNPAEDIVNIKIPFESKIVVYSIVGDLIYLSENKNITHTLKGLQPGIYIVDVGGIKKKIIVQ